MITPKFWSMHSKEGDAIMKKSAKKIVSALAGSSMLVSGAVAQAEVETPVAVTEAQAAEFVKVANVEGEFAFDQNVLSPADDVFNLFGTVLTSMCAKPAYEMENGKTDYYVNVGGKIAKSYTVDLKKSAGQTSRTLLCACSTGAATANVNVVGVKLENVLSLAEMAEDVNTLKVKGSDGYTMSMPLKYALEKQAMVVYKVNGEDVPSGTQLWVPGTVAKYFVRDVVDVELTAEAEVPAVEQRADELRAEVAFMNYAETTFKAGTEIMFEGYADDCGSVVTSVEFSLDGGETWTAFATEGASAEKWVYWNFTMQAPEAGDYQLAVRARTENGNVSPLAAKLNFSVAQPVV